MDKITVTKINETHLKVIADAGLLMELKEAFNFYVENFKQMPAYKAGIWDGKISPMNLAKRTFPVGLYKDLENFCKERDYELEILESDYGKPNDTTAVDLTEVTDFIEKLDLYSGNKKIEIRDYQVSSIFNCIKNQRLISMTPTGGGKSLIIYVLLRWYQENYKSGKFLLIVPNLGLIEQMLNDFKDYSSVNGFKVADNIQVIKGGTEKNITKPITISTWQSISGGTSKKLDPDWYRQWTSIIVDEVHGAKAASLSGLMNSATETKYRIGVTGSLDKSLTNKIILKGIFGEISKVTSTRELIERGFLSDTNIKCLVLKYNKDTHRLMSHADYQTEITFLTQHARRNKFIRELALSQKGNTLVLFTRVETHGELLYNLIKEKAGDREVFFIHGGVAAEERDQVRHLTENATNAIIVASVGTMSVGTNIKRLHNLIFASPTKSVIRVMQSLGRGLRKADDKDVINVYDIADVLYVTKSKRNTTMNHFSERLGIYIKERHPYKIIEVSLES